jgi:hypothetical protein
MYSGPRSRRPEFAEMNIISIIIEQTYRGLEIDRDLEIDQDPGARHDAVARSLLS